MARQKAAGGGIRAAVDMAGDGGTMACRARAMLRSGGDGRRIPNMALGTLTLLESCRECGVQPRLRLPRRPPP